MTEQERKLIENILGKDWDKPKEQLVNNYNPTCIYTGKKDNLIMKAHRNQNGDMVGWVFVHQSMADADDFDIEWEFTVTTRQKSQTDLGY